MNQNLLLIFSALVGLATMAGLGYLIFHKTGMIVGIILWAIAITVALIMGFSGEM